MGKTVLIFDDSNTMGKIVNPGLRQAALDVQAGEKPDIILWDINMPVLDGLDFWEAKGADASVKDIPVVKITTEGGSRDMAERSFSPGASGCVQKPFTPVQVNEIIGPLL